MSHVTNITGVYNEISYKHFLAYINYINISLESI